MTLVVRTWIKCKECGERMKADIVVSRSLYKVTEPLALICSHCSKESVPAGFERGPLDLPLEELIETNKLEPILVVPPVTDFVTLSLSGRIDVERLKAFINGMLDEKREGKVYEEASVAKVREVVDSMTEPPEDPFELFSYLNNLSEKLNRVERLIEELAVEEEDTKVEAGLSEEEASEPLEGEDVVLS